MPTFKFADLQNHLEHFANARYPLDDLIRDIHAHIGFVDPQTIRQTANKLFVGKEAFESEAITMAQATRILKIVARVKDYDLSRSPFSHYLKCLDQTPKPRQQPTGGSRSQPVEKVRYDCEIVYWDWRQFDWGEQFRLLFGQKLTAENLKQLILENHEENYGQRVAAALCWAQLKADENFFIRAAKIAQNTDLENLDIGVWTVWWDARNFEYFIDLVIARAFYDILQIPVKTYIPFIDLVEEKGQLYCRYPRTFNLDKPFPEREPANLPPPPPSPDVKHPYLEDWEALEWSGQFFADRSQVFQTLAAIAGGTIQGNFRASIRTDSPIDEAREIALDIFHILKEYCQTATATARERKSGACTISFQAGPAK